jgi:hypothetical protein
MKSADTYQTTFYPYPDSDPPARGRGNDHHAWQPNQVNKAIISIFVFVMILSMSGCTADAPAKAASVVSSITGTPARGTTQTVDDTDSKPCVSWPKRVAFLFDQTGSSHKTRTEHPAVDSLNDVIDCGKRRGGAIHVGPIRDTSNQPFAHLLIEPEPVMPQDTDLTGNALIDVDRATAHAHVMEGYEKRHRAWLERTNAAIERFRRSAGSLLAQPADARATDLVTAVERAYVGLSPGSRTRTASSSSSATARTPSRGSAYQRRVSHSF